MEDVYLKASSERAKMNFEGNRIVRINFIYILKTDSTRDTTNFQDMRSINGYITGYEYAEEIVSRANERLELNHPMHLPFGNNISVLPTRYRFSLAGVHYVDEINNINYADAVYRKHPGECINVFLSPDTNGTSDGYANSFGNYRDVTIWGTFTRHKKDEKELADGASEVYGMSTRAWVLAHETGHSLSLSHPLLYPGGGDDSAALCDDYCDDTINYPEAVRNAEEHCGHSNPTGQDSGEEDLCIE